MKKYIFKIWTNGVNRKANLITIVCDCIKKAWVLLMDELRTWKPLILESAMKIELYSVTAHAADAL